VRPFLRLPGESRQVSDILKALPAANVTLFRAGDMW
jgi:hypothetical protein